MRQGECLLARMPPYWQCNDRYNGGDRTNYNIIRLVIGPRPVHVGINCSVEKLSSSTPSVAAYEDLKMAPIPILKSGALIATLDITDPRQPSRLVNTVSIV